MIFSGPSNPELGQEIADHLGVQLAQMRVKQFTDGEIGIRIAENVRGKDCFIIQPTCPPDVNSHMMELLLMISKDHPRLSPFSYCSYVFLYIFVIICTCLVVIRSCLNVEYA